MEAVEQNTDDGLGGTRVVDDLRTHNLHEREPMDVCPVHSHLQECDRCCGRLCNQLRGGIQISSSRDINRPV